MNQIVTDKATAIENVRTDARNLVDWLSLPGAESRYPGANTMAGWLAILLTSCTPDSQELLAQEVERVCSILKG